MAGHFEAIGVADWRAFRDHAFDHGEWRRRPDGGDTIICRDESGATIVVWTNAANEVVYLAPSFDAQSRIPAGEVGVYENPEYPFSSVVSVDVLEGGVMLYPIATELENVHELFDQEVPREPGLLALTAFAEDVALWEDEAAYNQVEESPKHASQSFVPSGLFAERPEDIEARAFLAGIVEQANALTNQATGGDFVHALVPTYGATIDCVFSHNDLPHALLPGNVVQGEFWLMGRLLPVA